MEAGGGQTAAAATRTWHEGRGAATTRAGAAAATACNPFPQPASPPFPRPPQGGASSVIIADEGQLNKFKKRFSGLGELSEINAAVLAAPAAKVEKAPKGGAKGGKGGKKK